MALPLRELDRLRARALQLVAVLVLHPRLLVEALAGKACWLVQLAGLALLGAALAGTAAVLRVQLLPMLGLAPRQKLRLAHVQAVAALFLVSVLLLHLLPLEPLLGACLVVHPPRQAQVLQRCPPRSR